MLHRPFKAVTCVVLLFNPVYGCRVPAGKADHGGLWLLLRQPRPEMPEGLQPGRLPPGDKGLRQRLHDDGLPLGACFCGAGPRGRQPEK